jgi:DNA-binding HxlR family transcriptional regulator
MADRNPALCAQYHQAVELIGRRWAGAIIFVLMNGRVRYATLKESIPDITDRMLSERLRELEEAEIVVRHVTPDIPVRVEYELTPKGRSLEKSIAAIREWATKWVAPPGREKRSA